MKLARGESKITMLSTLKSITMRDIMCVVIIGFLSSYLIGCTSVVSPSYTYRPSNYSGPAWSVSGRVDQGVLKDTISITVNGERVAGGTLHELKRRDNFRGTYMGRQILAECEHVPLGLEYGYECTVFVDNERVTILNLK